jgi:hypothetical protein
MRYKSAKKPERSQKKPGAKTAPEIYTKARTLLDVQCYVVKNE